MQKLNEDVFYIPPQNHIKTRQFQWFVYPFEIRKLSKKYSIDLIVSWRTNAGAYATLATIGTKIKTVFSERSDPYMEPSNIHALTTYLAGLSDGGIFQTPKARDYYKHLASKSVVIPNPFDPDKTLSEIVDYLSRPKEIVHVGRMSILQKRHDLLLKTMVLIHKQLPDYKLRIYGDGKDMNKVKEMADYLELRNVVFLEGAVTNVIERIKNARLMLLTSDFEGIPNVVLEAFQAGVPVIATDCSPGGCHVLIDEDVNGFITPFRDYKATAQKAIDLLADEEKCVRFINNSLIKLQDFSPDKIYKSWVNYIEQVGNII